MTKRSASTAVIAVLMAAGLLFGHLVWNGGAGQNLANSLKSLGLDGPSRAMAATPASSVMVPINFTELAEKAKRTGKPKSVGQMNAYDRKTVHLALKNDPGVRTQSLGEGFYRKLVIFPKKGLPANEEASKTADAPTSVDSES